MNDFLKQKKELDNEFTQLSKTSNELKNTPEYKVRASQAIEKQKELEGKRNQLLSKQSNIEIQAKLLDKAVGNYTQMKAEQGTFLGGTWNWLLEGYSSVASGLTNTMIDVAGSLTPIDMLMSPEDLKSKSLIAAKELGIGQPKVGQTTDKWLSSLSQSQRDDIESKVRDLGKKQVKGNILPAVREGNRVVLGDPTTTTEWTNLKEQGFWGGAYAGLIKSIPAMASGNKAIRTAAFYSQISDSLEKEMSSNPEFKNISENEKAAIIVPIGIIGAVLEDYGLRNAIASKGLLNKIALKVIGKTTATTTARTFKELVQNEVESMIAKGALVTAAAGLAEFETGAAQQVSEFAVKDIYNATKGKKMFDNPQTFTAEWVKEVAVY